MITKETLAYKYGFLLGYIDAEIREDTMWGDSVAITIKTDDGYKLIDRISVNPETREQIYRGYDDGQEKLMIDTKERQYNK